MSTKALPQPGVTEIRPIAHPLHTLALLTIQVLMAVRGIFQAKQMQVPRSSNVGLYIRTIVIEWVLFAIVLAGVWFAGSPMSTVLGERFRSARDILRTVGIGVVFIIFQQLLLSAIGGHLLPGSEAHRTVLNLLPDGRAEMALWLALSLTAGICEETVFRGYLQRQFTALTQNVLAGILLSAAMFAFAHGYQGFCRAVVIGLDGALLGGLVHWCGTVRPGMVGHALKDALAPFLMVAVKH